jgi:shikimate dehydrogenase
VVAQSDGRLVGHSTDGAGFVASLRESGVDPAGRRVVVIGAGAAGRAVVDALARAGAGAVEVVNRSRSRAEEAAQLAGAVGGVVEPTAVADADIVVNATSVGMGSDALAVDPALLHAGQVVADLVYHPLETALLRAARLAGATTVDGLGMLVHQAALQQQLWLGTLPDAAVMREAALRELDARSRIS